MRFSHKLFLYFFDNICYNYLEVSYMVHIEHRCDENKTAYLSVELVTQFNTIIESVENPYTYSDFLKLMDFYLIHPLNEERYAQKILRDTFHWRQKRKVKNGAESFVLNADSMFRQMLKVSGLENNVRYTYTENATKIALQDMDLAGSYICAAHPRAVLHMNSNTKIVEDNEGNLTVETTNTEAGYRCIFRHIRNAFAHNNVFFYDNGNILLKDYQRNNDKQIDKKVTAAILIKFDTLFDWIQLIETDQEII